MPEQHTSARRSGTGAGDIADGAIPTREAPGDAERESKDDTPTRPRAPGRDIAEERTVTLPRPATPPAAPAPSFERGGAAASGDASEQEAARVMQTVRLGAVSPAPGGGLTTTLGEPGRAGEVGRVARDAQRRVRHDGAGVAQALEEVARALHAQTKRLERFVDGHFSNDLGDPRTQLLAETLAVAADADTRLGRLSFTLQRLNADARVAEDQLVALQRERERLTTLYNIAQELNTALDLDDLLARVLALLIEVVRAERGCLLLWDDAQGELRFTAGSGADGAALAEEDFSLSRGIAQSVWTSQQALLTHDALGDIRLNEHASVIANGIRSVMCAPLRVRDHAVGVVYVDSRNQTALFDSTTLDLLAAFCNQAAIAIDNARLVADLRRHIREIGEMKTYRDNIFASIASGVVTADTEGVITTFNRAAEQMMGAPAQQVVGRAYHEVIARLGSEPLTAILQRTIEEQAVTRGYELNLTLAARGEVHLRLNVSPLRADDGEGEALGFAVVLDDLTELRRSQRQTDQIQRLFGRYVHPAVVAQLLADPTAVHLGGETREISVVFADIRGYTGLAERTAPDELVRLLNEHLRVLTEAVWQEEGTLTMFIGDALMAIFNAPLAQPDHARRATRAAWAMRAALERLHASEPSDVSYGIGVHTGQAVVGNIGARDRLQNYTAIGDAVNIAQRLQANASANQILLSAATYAEVAPVVVAHALAPLAVKGKALPIAVYQLDDMR